MTQCIPWSRVFACRQIRKSQIFPAATSLRKNVPTRVTKPSTMPVAASSQRRMLLKRVGHDGGRRLLKSLHAHMILPNIQGRVYSTRSRISWRDTNMAAWRRASSLPLQPPSAQALSSTVASTKSWTSPHAASLPLLASSTSGKSALFSPACGAPTSGLMHIPHLKAPLAFKERYFSSSSQLQLRKQRLSRVASFLSPPPPWSRVDWVNFSTESVITSAEKSPVQTHKLGYRVSASFSAKSEKVEIPHTFTYSPYTNACKKRELSFAQRKRARVPSGQDAFFISKTQEQGGIAMGVADGVGGYIHSGIDSADFSHELCDIMACMARSAPMKFMHPRTLLNAAYVKLIEDEEIPGGASTACVGVAWPSGVFTVANLGDSGYVIFRDGKVVHTSTPQTHSFNTPYQLSVIPPKLLEQSRTFGGDFLCDLPKDANVAIHNLVHGDVVVFATDGLWDNLSTQQILKIVCKEMISRKGWINGSVAETSPKSGEKQPPRAKIAGIHPSDNLAQLTENDVSGLQSVIANAIASKAKVMSLSTSIDGPFAKEVQRQLPAEMWYNGGKKDDICVVCMIVTEQSEGPVKVSSNKPQTVESPEAHSNKKMSRKELSATSPSAARNIA